MQPQQSTIDRLRRNRASAVRLMMAEQQISTEQIATRAGRSTGLVDEFIAGQRTSPVVFDAMALLLGSQFTRLWLHYPDHLAA